MSELKVRQPKVDFARSLPHWNAKEPEFSQINNAASSILPHLEPYLIKVIRQAREEIAAQDKENDAELLEDMDLFIRQEANHYKLHQAYNSTLHNDGYAVLKEHEQKLAADYKMFLAERSLKFNLAYSEGFESLGVIQAEFFFSHAQRWLNEADESVRALWEWHLAEEYEHRRVCYDTYKRLHGGYFYRCYSYRIYGLLYAIRHLEGYGKRVSKVLIEQDRLNGKINDGWRSHWREHRYRMKLSAFGMFKLCRTLSPFYNPARLEMPAGADVRLERMEKMERAERTEPMESLALR